MTIRSLTIFVDVLQGGRKVEIDLCGAFLRLCSHENLRPFAKMAMRVGTFSTVFTETTVAEESQLCLADFLSCQDPRQEQIQDCDSMIKTASRHS
jgi:hypothetical protein